MPSPPSFKQNIKPAKDIDGVRRSAFWHLGRRDHSEKELREKLARKTDHQDWIDNVINECIEYGYLDDRRFIENFIRACHNKGFGITRIKRDLHRKGIDAKQLEHIFADIDHDYIASATALLSTKYDKQLTNQHIKHKAMTFLQGKGHAFNDILEAIEQHNHLFPDEQYDSIADATALLSGKFKTVILDRKIQDKALRFLVSRGYNFADSLEAIKTHNEQIDRQD